MAMGRPTKLGVLEKNIEQIKKWKEFGATDEQVCKQLKIAESTYYRLLNKSPKLKDEINTSVQKFVIDLKGELAYKATKHTLETKKQYIKVDLETGHKTQYTEITTKEVDGDLGSICILLKNLDKSFSDNPQMLELKKQELELRKQMAEDKLF